MSSTSAEKNPSVTFNLAGLEKCAADRAEQQSETEAESTTTNPNVSLTLSRASSTIISLAGSVAQRASSNLQGQTASSLPTKDDDLRHAATMPSLYDVEADRVWCFGLWKTQQLLGFLLGVGSAILFSCVPVLPQFTTANDMLGVTSLVAFFWVFEVVPVYVTALFPLVLMPFLKITSSEIAAQGYWNGICLLVVGTYLLDIALEEVQLPRRIALNLLLKFGVVHPAVLLACFMSLSWLMSMFINTIAVALIVTPFAVGLMGAAQDQVLENAMAEAMEEEGAVEKAAQAARSIQKFADGLLLGIAFGATAGGISTLTGFIGNYFLVSTASAGSTDQITWGMWYAFAMPLSFAVLLLAYAALYIRYVRHLKFSGIEKQVLVEEYAALMDSVGPFSRDEFFVGLLQVLQIAFFMLRPLVFAPFIQTEYGQTLLNDATLACAPALALFFIPSQLRPGQALLTWPAVHKKFDFGLLLLIGGALSISTGFSESGLNVALGDAVAKLIPEVHPFVLDLLIMVCVTCCTQVFSSIGTAAALLPVLDAAALSAVVNPLTLLLPATVATSFAFILPTATPTNVIVYAKSQELTRSLRLRDFVQTGLPLTLVALIVGAGVTSAMGRVVFNSYSPFPEWACAASSASCLWVPVQGAVMGAPVESQACIVKLGVEANGDLCQLWNGTLLSTAPHVMALP